ncbi:MAG: helix-turn-helix transcriptional regulator [Clostridia bacterium]|nr:helix-turn-helix transcriptional regulator [Clostridia bacterium]
MKKPESIYKVFMERLKELMEDKNINMKVLSENTAIPRSTINSWNLKERLPSAECLFALAEYFEVTVDYLLGREN